MILVSRGYNNKCRFCGRALSCYLAGASAEVVRYVASQHLAMAMKLLILSTVTPFTLGVVFNENEMDTDLNRGFKVDHYIFHC